MTTTALTKTIHPDSAIVQFEPENFSQAQHMATELSKSDLVPVHLRGKPANVLLVVMRGRELGISPMQSLRMNVINGNVGLPSDMMVALVKRQPECEVFRCVKRTEQVATWISKRKGQDPVEHSFTIEKAKKAGLLKSDMYSKWTDNMLMWRCASELARMEWPEVFAGVYSSEEIAEMRGEDRGPVYQQPASATGNGHVVDATAEEVPDHDPVTGVVNEPARRREAPPPSTQPTVSDDDLEATYKDKIAKADSANDREALAHLAAELTKVKWANKTQGDATPYGRTRLAWESVNSRLNPKPPRTTESAPGDRPHP